MLTLALPPSRQPRGSDARSVTQRVSVSTRLSGYNASTPENPYESHTGRLAPLSTPVSGFLHRFKPKKPCRVESTGCYPHTERREDRQAGHFGSLGLDTGGISTPLQQLCMVDRPGPDASRAEIARWMEEDFGEALAEGMKQATEEDEGDEHDE